MASSQPIIRQVKWLSLVPQLVVFFLLWFIYNWINIGDPLLLSAVTYFLTVLAVRNLIPKHHRKGIQYFKKERYEEAVQEFEKSYDFFQRNEWIDKYRYLTLLSSSRISYLEMALLNMAFCYGQLGQGLKSKELYQMTLNRFPESKVAQAALKMLSSVKEIKE